MTLVIYPMIFGRCDSAARRNMKHIHLAESFPLRAEDGGKTDKTVTKLLDDEYCRIVAVQLRNGAKLSKHRAAEPISLLCISGTGTFTAGADLEDSTNLTTGTLLTLPAGVEHEVTATTALRILVTKYKRG